jgi:hypothetical protein
MLPIEQDEIETVYFFWTQNIEWHMGRHGRRTDKA